MEKGNFEQSWKDAFNGAEVVPSDAVWTNVELDLEKASGGKMKKRLLFYQMLAAASFVFAMGVAGTYYLSSIDKQSPLVSKVENDSVNNSSPDSSISETENSNVNSSSNSSAEQNHPNQVNTVSKDERSFNKRQSSSKLTSTNVTGSSYAQVKAEDFAAENKDQSVSKSFKSFDRQPQSKLVTFKQPVLVMPNEKSTADPGMLLLAKLKDEEMKYQKEDKKKDKSSGENVWTSLGVSAGSFNPNASSSSVAQASISSGNFTTSSAGPSAGSSYSLGLNVGGRVANRFVLQGGVAYLTQNATYTSTAVAMESGSKLATLNDHAFHNTQTFANSPQVSANRPYEVNSNLQYISVPMQAGYMILDKGFAIQLNGGVATDFFMMNTLTPDTDDVAKVSQGSGADSPYRSVNFSGLVGTEFSYRIGDHYRLAVNPGIRYALNSIYKADVATEVSPITYDVALRFRYIFK